MKTLLCFLALAAPLAAQGDFLTNAEVEKIRDAQEPNLRMETYASFGKERIDLIKSLMAKDKPGRSLTIHDALDDFAKIVDAMDDVTDDALERKIEVKKGVEALERMETAALVELTRIQDSHPRDLERYEFALTQAIDTAKDSLDAAREDLGERMNKLLARRRQEEEREQQESAPVEGAKVPVTPVSPDTQKAPTLLKPGEMPPPNP